MATIGSKIDKLFALQEQKSLLNEALKELEEKIRVAEIEVMETMDTQNVSKATGAKASVGITSSVKPTVEDWDAFYAFIKRNSYFHLLERRPSTAGCREMFELRGNIPGVKPYEVRRLSVRSKT